MLNLKRDLRDRHLIAVMGEADLVTGMLLAGCGGSNNSSTQNTNYIINDPQTTSVKQLEEAFRVFTCVRTDIAILIVSQPTADRIRHLIDDHQGAWLPAILEVPGKDTAYDPEKDSMLKRINRLCGQ